MKKRTRSKKVEAKTINQKKGLVSNSISFAKSKPYFVIALIFSLALIAFFIYITIVPPSQLTQEEVDYASSLFMQNSNDLNEMLTNVTEELTLTPSTTLEDDYLNSIKDDIDWLTSKQKNVYYYSKRDDVLINELAFTVLMQKIIDVDSYFALDLGVPDYEAKINEAKTITLKGENFFTKTDLNEMFSDLAVQQKFFNALNQQLAQYERSRRLIIDNSTSVERKFVESKKLVILSRAEEEILAE